MKYDVILKKILGAQSIWLIFKFFDYSVFAYRHANWKCSSRQSLCRCEDIRDDSSVILETKQFSCASESNHNFIAVHQNVVLVTDRAHFLHVAIGRHDQNTFTHNGLELNQSRSLLTCSFNIVSVFVHFSPFD